MPQSRPLVCPVSRDAVLPFVSAYCAKFGVDFMGDVDMGLTVKWYGAVHERALRAVIGYVTLPEGIYVTGYYHDNSPFGPRSFLALNKFTYDLKLPLWGYIRKDNEKMWKRMLKEGWIITLDNGVDYLVHWPSQSGTIVKTVE